MFPSAIDISCTVHESRALVEALPSIRGVLCVVHKSRGVRKLSVSRENEVTGSPG